jgi:hypothetical protein
MAPARRLGRPRQPHGLQDVGQGVGGHVARSPDFREGPSSIGLSKLAIRSTRCQSPSSIADDLSCDPDGRSSVVPRPRRNERRVMQSRRLIIQFAAQTGEKQASTEGDQDMTTHKGKCFCGAVEIEVQGEPEGMGYCHCSSCRSWSAAPVNAFTLWKPQNVRVSRGAELIGKYMKTESSHRQYCKRCGGHLMTDHPPLGLVDVYAATIPALKFTPHVHVNYAETVLPMKDGLPKLRDFPAELGGSGVAIPE